MGNIQAILTLIFTPFALFIAFRVIWRGWKALNSNESAGNKSIYKAETRRDVRGVYLAMMIFCGICIAFIAFGVGGLILQHYGLIPNK